VNHATQELVLGLIDDRTRSLVNARQLAVAQLGRHHPNVGEICEQLERLDRARAEVSTYRPRAA
jgi:hypothetical protein